MWSSNLGNANPDEKRISIVVASSGGQGVKEKLAQKKDGGTFYGDGNFLYLETVWIT